MRETLLSIWAWALTGLLVLAWFPLLAVVWLFDADPVRYRTGRLFRRLGALLTYINPFWDIEVLGEAPDDMRGPYVVVSNHLSHADVPIISRLPWEMKWVAKRELFDIPLAGWMMQMARDIPVDRGSKRSRAQVLVRARHVLQADCPVMFFPEGTRSRDGRIHRFAEGPFRLAIREGARVLDQALGRLERREQGRQRVIGRLGVQPDRAAKIGSQDHGDPADPRGAQRPAVHKPAHGPRRDSQKPRGLFDRQRRQLIEFHEIFSCSFLNRSGDRERAEPLSNCRSIARPDRRTPP